MLAIALFFSLGPVKPVLPFDNIQSQFPDVGNTQPNNFSDFNHSYDLNQNRPQPWKVESWSGGGRSVKGFNDYRAAIEQNNAAGANNGFGNGPGNGFGNNGFGNGPGNGFGNNGFGNGPGNAGFNNNSFGNNRFGNNAQPNINTSGNPRADKFADNPQIDQNGVRHFDNGRHYNIKTTPMDQAIAISADADDQLKQNQALAARQKRQRNRNGFGF